MSVVVADEVPECLLMPLRDVADHATERGRVIARVGIGTCPRCGHEGEAEAGKRLYCPRPACAGLVLAVIRPGGAHA